jgi:hypothetical protein
MDPKSKAAKDMALNNLSAIEQLIERLKKQIAKLQPEEPTEPEEFFAVKEVD